MGRFIQAIILGILVLGAISAPVFMHEATHYVIFNNYHPEDITMGVTKWGSIYVKGYCPNEACEELQMWTEIIGYMGIGICYFVLLVIVLIFYMIRTSPNEKPEPDFVRTIKQLSEKIKYPNNVKQQR